MTCHYPDLGSASEGIFPSVQIRSIIQTWLVTRHQYGISALVPQTTLWGCLWLPIMECAFSVGKKKTKMEDSSPRRRCVSHSPFGGADFCGEGTGNFRSPGDLERKQICTYFTEKLLALYVRRLFFKYRYSMMFLAFVGAAETIPSHGPHGKSFNLLQFSPWM